MSSSMAARPRKKPVLSHGALHCHGECYLRFPAAFPALDAAPNGLRAAAGCALFLSALGFFFSRLPLDICRSPVVPVHARRQTIRLSSRMYAPSASEGLSIGPVRE